jgi:hypothetical protein
MSYAGRDTHRRRPRGATAAEARPPGLDPDLPRLGLQGSQAVSHRFASLRSRLFAAIVLVALLSLALALALGAAGHDAAQSSGTRFATCRRSSTSSSCASRRDPAFARLRSLHEQILDRQDDSCCRYRSTDPSPAPARSGRAAPSRRPARGHAPDGRHALPLRRAARQGQGLHAAAARELDELGLAAPHRGSRHRGGRRPPPLPP